MFLQYEKVPMDKNDYFDEVTCAKVLKRLLLRLQLTALLSTCIGGYYLFYGDGMTRELGFTVYTFIALFILFVGMIYKYSHNEGRFGVSDDNKRFIRSWLNEENYWYGKADRKSVV